MSVLAEVLVNGVVLGLVYALMALGLAFIYSIMRTVNFAHGEFYVAGAYAYYLFSKELGLPVAIAIPLGVAVAVGLAWLVERLLLRPVAQGKVDRPGDYILLITLALSIMLQKLYSVIFGPFSRQPEALATGQLLLGSVQLTGERLAVAVGGAAAILALFLFIKYTWVGKMFLATAQSRFGAQAIGVDVRKMTTLAFLVGAALASIGGILLTPVFSVFPTAGIVPVVKGFVVIVLAGLGSIAGTIWTGLLVGLAEMAGAVLVSSAYRDAYAFGLLILVLLLRPQGLFGEKERLA